MPNLASAADLGRADPGKLINLTLLLKMHDEAGLQKVVDALYNHSSPTFRKWLTAADLAKYAPTQAEYAAVKAELLRNGYKVIATDPQRFSIRVRGTVAITEKAFPTELHEVASAGINRPDVIQRMGYYRPPPGAPSFLGMEVAGSRVD